MALLWSGCTDNDTGPVSDASQIITFGPAAVESPDVHSRSTLVSSFADGEQMIVYGYCVPMKINNIGEYSPEQSVLRWVNKADYSTPDVFNGVTLTVSGGRPGYDNPMPWYTSGTTNPDMSAVNTDNCRYSFMSYYPAAGAFTYERNNAAGNTTTGAPRFIFTMPDAAATDHTRIPDAMVAARFDHLRNDGRVNFTYSHILTALRFQINNYSSETADVLHIHSLTLKGQFFKKATFDFDEGTVNQTTGTEMFGGEWQLLASAMDVGAGMGSPLGEGTTGTSVLLLPDPSITPDAAQDLDCIGSGKKIIVTYSLGTGAQKTTEIDLRIPFKPLAGVSYAINLNFVGDEFVIYFNPTDLWEHGSDNDIDIK